MLNKDEIITFLRQNKSQLQKKFLVSKIGLFGSYSKDQNSENSDVDIIVDMPSDFDKYYDLKYFLEDSFNCRVDLGLEKNIRELLKDKIQEEVLYV